MHALVQDARNPYACVVDAVDQHMRANHVKAHRLWQVIAVAPNIGVAPDEFEGLVNFLAVDM